MNSILLWEDEEFEISTPKNPHIPYNDGLQIIVAPKREVANAWQDIGLGKTTFGLAAQACKLMEKAGIAPWFNLQANGNWGLLPGGKPFFHIHVYGRNRESERWAKPVILPDAPGTYQNDPMPEADQDKLKEIFKLLRKNDA